MTNQIVNSSGLKPLGRAVLVKAYDMGKKVSAIALLDSTQERMLLVDTRVVVVECGAHCWPNEPARAKAGDKVIISKFAGAMARGTADDAVYRVVNDNDIYVQIVEERETENG